MKNWRNLWKNILTSLHKITATKTQVHFHEAVFEVKNAEVNLFISIDVSFIFYSVIEWTFYNWFAYGLLMRLISMHALLSLLLI